MMNTRKDEIEQENKKALPKFRRIIVASLVLGLVLGSAGSFLSFFGAEDFLDRMWNVFSQFVAPVLLMLTAVGTLIYETVMIRSNAARLRQWDGEDETAFDKMDRSITYALSAVNLLMIVGYCLFPIALYPAYLRHRHCTAKAGRSDQDSLSGEKRLCVSDKLSENLDGQLRRGGAAAHRAVRRQGHGRIELYLHGAVGGIHADRAIFEHGFSGADYRLPDLGHFSGGLLLLGH